jgi:hypothetical protein
MAILAASIFRESIRPGSVALIQYHQRLESFLGKIFLGFDLHLLSEFGSFWH